MVEVAATSLRVRGMGQRQRLGVTEGCYGAPRHAWQASPAPTAPSTHAGAELVCRPASERQRKLPGSWPAKAAALLQGWARGSEVRRDR
eukprot:1161298-Pelagomonas_calceolata.AAC.13